MLLDVGRQTGRTSALALYDQAVAGTNRVAYGTVVPRQKIRKLDAKHAGNGGEVVPALDDIRGIIRTVGYLRPIGILRVFGIDLDNGPRLEVSGTGQAVPSQYVSLGNIKESC